MIKCVYAITNINSDYFRSNNAYKYYQTSTIGIYGTLERAKEAVIKNYGGIDEGGTCILTVIEPIRLDCVYPIQDDPNNPEQYWFAFDGELSRSWIELDEIPEIVTEYIEKHNILNQWFNLGG